MKIRYRFAVEGIFRISQPRTHSRGDALISVEVTEGGTVIGLVVTYPFPDWRKYPAAEVTTTQDGSYHLELPEYPRHDDAERMAATIEARLTPFGVDRIAVDQVSIGWVPESEEERKEAVLHSFSTNPGVPEAALPRYRPALLKAASRERSFDRAWDLQLAFYRAAWVEMRRFQYGKAYIYFFLFLEGLFGNSQIKTAALKQAFLENDEFTGALRLAIGKRQTNQAGASFDLESEIGQIIRRRGILFHNPERRTEKWDPEQPGLYAEDANLLANISATIVLQREWPPEDGTLPVPISIVDKGRLAFDRFLAQE